MSHVQQLRHSQNVAGIPTFQPGLSLVRSADHPTDANSFARPDRVLSEANTRVGDMGVLWPQRKRNQNVGERTDGARTDWPGKELGIRQPNPTETALSWEEVNHWFATGPHQ